MGKAFGNVVGASALAILFAVAPTAHAQVVVGPGQQSGAPGQEVAFAFSLTGSSAVSGFGFNLLYNPQTAPFEPVLESGETVKCTVEPDIAANVAPLVFSFPDRGFIAISFGDFAFPISAIGREGVIASCSFMIKADAAPGDVPLQCEPESATASDATGEPIDVTCEDGTLSIVVPTETPTQAPPTPTATQVPATQTPTKAPATLTPTKAPTAPSSGFFDDDGCQISANGSSGSAWFLLIPAAVLFVVRRKSR